MKIKNILCAVLMMSSVLSNSVAVAGGMSSEEAGFVAKLVVAVGVVGIATVAGTVGGAIAGGVTGGASKGLGGAIAGTVGGGVTGGLALFAATYAYMNSGK